MADERIDLVITARNKADRALSSVTGHLKGITNRVFNLKNALAGLGIGLLARDLVRHAGEQQRAVAGLETALRSMGRYTPELSARLQDLASELQGVTNFGDEATLQGQKFLTTYKNIGDELMGRSTRAMLDLAALMKGDVVSAANMLGKASMGMTGELRRVGVTVDQETYKLHGYAGVLEQIEQQVSGQAQAMREATGPWVALGNAVGDVKEEGGDLLNEVFGPLGDGLTELFGDLDRQIEAFKESADFQQWAEEAGEDIVAGFETALLGTASIVDTMRPVVAGIWETVEQMWDGFQELPDWAKEVGILGALLGGTKGKAMLALMAMGADILERQSRAAEAYAQGRISLSEWATADNAELEALLDSRRKRLEMMPSHGESAGILPNNPGPDMMASHGNDPANLPGLPDPEESATTWARRFLDQLHTSMERGRQTPGDSPGASGGPAVVGAATPDLGSLQLGDFANRFPDRIKEGVGEEFNLLSEEISRIGEDLTGLEKQSQETFSQTTQFAEQAARNIQDSFAQFLFDPFEDGLSGMLQSFSDTLRMMAAQIASSQILSGVFGGLAGSDNPILAGIGKPFVGKFHDGGLVAPRSHPGGLLPDEVPAVLQTGERVLSREQNGVLEQLAGHLDEVFGGLAGIGQSFGGKFHDGGPVLPRFHFGGLLPDEVPAVLQTGERVLSREQNRVFEQLANQKGAGTEIHIHEPEGARANVQRERGPQGQELVTVMFDALEQGISRGRFDRTFGQVYGLRRKGG